MCRQYVSHTGKMTAMSDLPALATMADAFHVTSEKINLTVTVYL